jgi:outer membrane protein assembly factor BamB
MADLTALHAEASNPLTEPARLASLVAEHPALGATVAANPAAYDGLLDWLAQYGDAAAQHAVTVRRGTAAPAAAVAPPAPKAPRAPLSAGAKKGLLFGGIGLAAVAVIGTTAVVLVNALGGGSAVGTLNVAEIMDEPRDDAWELISPLAEDADEDATLGALVMTVGQDRALVTWIATGEDSLTSLVDTRSGSILWTIDDFESEVSLLSEIGVTPYLVLDEEGDIYALDPSNGDILSDTSKLGSTELVAEQVFSTSGGRAASGDVILRTEDEVGLYSANELDEPRWVIDWDDKDAYPVLAGNRVIIGEDAFDARTGEEVDWSGDEDIDYFGFRGKIYGREGDSSDGDLLAFSDSGDELWSTGYSGFIIFTDEKRFVFFNQDDEELMAIDLASGEELWSVDAEFNNGYTYGGAGNANALVLPVGKEDEATAFDLTTGEELFSFEASEPGNWALFMIGAAQRVFYFTGNDDGDLIALSTRDGEELWSLSGDDDSAFQLAGGNLVSITRVSGDDAQDDAVLRGIQP